MSFRPFCLISAPQFGFLGINWEYGQTSTQSCSLGTPPVLTPLASAALVEHENDVLPLLGKPPGRGHPPKPGGEPKPHVPRGARGHTGARGALLLWGRQFAEPREHGALVGTSSSWTGFGHDLALVLGVLGWDGAGRVLPHVRAQQRALSAWFLPPANKKSPREKHVPGTTQQARIQDRRCELKACHSDNDHK